MSTEFQPAVNPSVVQAQSVRAPGRAHVLVVGNEKGGSGKSTTAMHIIVSLPGVSITTKSAPRTAGSSAVSKRTFSSA